MLGILKQVQMNILLLNQIVKGGQGSGNFGHSGRPGEVGGSGGGAESFSIVVAEGQSVGSSFKDSVKSGVKAIPKEHYALVSKVELHKDLTDEYNQKREAAMTMGINPPAIPKGAYMGGNYNKDTRVVKLSSEVGSRGGAVLAHEVGHAVYNQKLSSSEKSAWGKYSSGVKNRISDYAKTGSAEHFSEAYSAYYTNRSQLDKVEPGAAKYFSLHFSKVAESFSGVIGSFEYGGDIYFLVGE